MRDPQPVFGTLAICLVGMVLLLMWFFGQDAGQRNVMLYHIGVAEQVEAPIPLGLSLEDFVAQVLWLVQHRKAQLQGGIGLGGVALAIGACLGVSWRRRSIYKGFLHKHWAIGVFLLPVLLGACGFYLILPWPLAAYFPLFILAGVVLLMGFFLASGLPFIP